VAERFAPSTPRLRRADDVAREAGEALAEALRLVLAARDVARLAIPGGSALAALSFAREQLGESWQRVALTWVDERCVPEADPESNRGTARRRGLLFDPAPARCLALYEDDETPAQAVVRASAAIRGEFDGALDVLLLGLGEDGHIASLFPGSGLSPSDAALGDAPVAHVADSPKPPADRITLTRPLLGTAGASILLATGELKRAALCRLLAGDEALPAHGLSRLQIFTDLTIYADDTQTHDDRARSQTP
jgi:6-phosphogluconolactonase